MSDSFVAEIKPKGPFTPTAPVTAYLVIEGSDLELVEAGLDCLTQERNLEGEMSDRVYALLAKVQAVRKASK